MSYHARIETSEYASFLTTRSRNSELWLINNTPLEEAILGYAALCKGRYGVALYGLAIEGNHIQGPATFVKENRASFMRDFNSSVARAIPRYTPEYPGGSFWARRYSAEFLPAGEDIEEYFFYTALQPIQDGLVEKLSEYPGYHFFHDAIWGIERTYKVVKWKEYRAAQRRKKFVPIKDFIIEVKLRYDRVPGYEELTQKEYALMMAKKLEERRVEIVNRRKAQGLGFLGAERMKQIPRGARALNSKRSTIETHRPRVLSVSNERRAAVRAWYFEKYFAYKEASKRYRAGDYTVEFPAGMYKPMIPHRGPPVEKSP